jgi:curved DNA-binding protein CbpA
MATLNLPPDPYLALGVSKDAKLPEIRSAHRKLVLKCHPDKVQDADLKAVKQDEFQKVQHAYEILSDDVKRLQYDEQVKLFELRKEMGRGVPTPRSNPFEFEVRSAEPRPAAYATRSRGPPPTKIYTTQSPPKPYDIPKMYEDIMHDKPLRTARKSSSYEYSEKKREDERQRETRKRDEEDRERQKWEKEKKRAAHGEKKKARDKEKRRDTDEKRTRTTRPYVEDDSDDAQPALPREKKPSRDKHRMEEEIKMRNEAAVRASASPRTPVTAKWQSHEDSALEYMHAARSKVPDDGFRHPGMRRAETFSAETVYNVRYATPTKAAYSSDEDTPRRSSGRRRASETPSRSRDESKKEKESKRSSSTRKAYPDIVDPPSSPPTLKTPKFKTHTSAPIESEFTKEFTKPVRSKTDYPRKDKESSVPSPLLRAQTFHSGERDRGRDREGNREGSKLRNPVQYDSAGSDDERPIYATPRNSRSPPRPARASHSPPRRREAPETKRYIIDQGRSVPISPPTRHRSEMHSIDDENFSPRDRSESPRGGRKSERPPVTSSGSRQTPQRSQSQAYYPPTVEPVILTSRPKLSRDHGSSGSRGSPLYGELKLGDVKFRPNYTADDIRYSPQSDPYRRGSEPTRENYSSRGGRGEVYV